MGIDAIPPVSVYLEGEAFVASDLVGTEYRVALAPSVEKPEDIAADVVAGIAAARRLGYPEQEIADFYGISVATVDRVLMDRKA